MSKQSLIKGTTILAVAGIVVKLLGAVFRLPLVNWIGDTGMANYSPAYYIYAFLVILATSGLPVAISKMVSESIAIGNHYQAHRVFKLSTSLMFGMGLVFFIILFFFAPQIANLMNNPDAALGMRVIAPSLLLVPIMAAFRGYFQGMQNMKPTAISQVVEQFFRVFLGLGAAYVLFFVVGDDFIEGVDKYVRGAAGANFGATAGSIGGLLIILFIYGLARKGILKRAKRTAKMGCASNKRILKRVLVIAVPITIGAAIMPILNLVDSALVMNRLTDAAGFSHDAAQSLYGQLSGFVSSLINIPQVLTQSVAVSLVPIIAASNRTGEVKQLHDNVNLGIRMSVIIGYPCAIGLMVLAEPILLLLYPNQAESASNAASILMIMAFGLIFLSITQTLTGVLQGVDKQMIPVKNLMIGMVFKIVLTWILVGIPSINVNGAAVGTVVAYLVAITLNLRAVKKYTGIRINNSLTFVRPLISSVVMGVIVFLAYKLFMLAGHNSIATLLSVAVGGIVYVIMIFITKSITKDELLMLPKGDKIAKIVGKFVK